MQRSAAQVELPSSVDRLSCEDTYLGIHLHGVEDKTPVQVPRDMTDVRGERCTDYSTRSYQGYVQIDTTYKVKDQGLVLLHTLVSCLSLYLDRLFIHCRVAVLYI